MSKILAIFGNVALYGQERSNIKVFDTLKNAGHDIFLLVNDYGFHWHLQPEIEAHGFKYTKIRYAWFPNKQSSLKFILVFLRDIIIGNYHFYREYRRYKPDYIHVANQSFFLTLLPVILFVKTPIIFRLGDQPVRRNFIERWLWLYMLKRVNHFVCVSKFIVDELIQIKSDFKNYSIIYNVPPSRKAIIENEKIPIMNRDIFTVVYIGQIEELKGVHLLFEASKQIIENNNNIRFIFTGQLYMSQLYEVIKKDSSYAFNPTQLIFTDKIQNIDAIYQIGDIHVAPSLVQEALSNVVGEAKQNGLPSIVFNSGGLSELVTHGVDGYICKDKTVKELVKAINFYNTNRDELYQQSQNARASLLALGLTEEKFKTKWITIYS